MSALAISLKTVQRFAEPHGIVLAISGVHAMTHWRDQKMAPSQRYAELVQEIQWPSRRLQTMAVHVHVGLRASGRSMPVINAFAVSLPHLLGLSASSPFWCGEDTGLASTRCVVFGALPHTGPPLGLPDWKSFEDYMDGQLRAGTIRTIKEVWWDVRPHPDFGTVEVRIADAVPTAREVGMLAALVQCMV
ncbi:carboxylate--amine ligase, partial [Lactococcus lactis]